MTEDGQQARSTISEFDQGYHDGRFKKKKASYTTEYLRGYERGAITLAVERGSIRWSPNTYETEEERREGDQRFRD